MKTFFVLIGLCVSVCFFFACSEQEVSPKGTATALCNGEPWTADWIAEAGWLSPNVSDTNRYLSFIFAKGKMRYAEHMSFHYYPGEIGSFPIRKTNFDFSKRQTASYSSSNYDVPGDDYDVLEELPDGVAHLQPNNPSAHFTITSIVGNEVQGTFAVTFLRYRSHPLSPLPDTLRFTEGKFRVHIRN
ncbi:MAG: hypothetical protein ACFCUI_01840 [Bernardetiaceae bacterium]